MMKRSFSFATSLSAGTLTLLYAVPAFAQDYYGSGDDGLAALAGLGIWTFCCLAPIVLLGVFNLWMLIDAIMRQEYEYPNSTGNSKLI